MLLSIDDSEVNEEMENLIKSLEERSRMIEYQNMRLGVEYLSERADVGRDIFVKNPQPIEIDKTYPYTHDPEELPEAILQIKKRTRRKLPPPVSSFHGIVGKEAFPVSVKITELLQQFIFRPVAKLKQLIVGCKSRSEIVATFLAVLELCKGKAHIRSDGRIMRSVTSQAKTTNQLCRCLVKSMEINEIETALEGILFAAGDPVPADRLSAVLGIDRSR